MSGEIPRSIDNIPVVRALLAEQRYFLRREELLQGIRDGELRSLLLEANSLRLQDIRCWLNIHAFVQ